VLVGQRAVDAEPATGQDEQVVSGRRSDQPAIGRDGTRIVQEPVLHLAGQPPGRERNDVDRLRPAAHESDPAAVAGLEAGRLQGGLELRQLAVGDEEIQVAAGRGQAADHHQPSLARGVHQLGLRAVDDGGSGRERRVGRGVEHPGRRR
jgi:hypothetical protein